MRLVLVRLRNGDVVQYRSTEPSELLLLFRALKKFFLTATSRYRLSDPLSDYPYSNDELTAT